MYTILEILKWWGIGVLGVGSIVLSIAIFICCAETFGKEFFEFMCIAAFTGLLIWLVHGAYYERQKSIDRSEPQPECVCEQSTRL